jgi:hypothetical protein
MMMQKYSPSHSSWKEIPPRLLYALSEVPVYKVEKNELMYVHVTMRERTVMG